MVTFLISETVKIMNSIPKSSIVEPGSSSYYFSDFLDFLLFWAFFVCYHAYKQVFLVTKSYLPSPI